MWIFTNQGFVSAVEHRDNSELLMVRARAAGHLEAVFPGCTVQKTMNADYRYRTVLSKAVVAAKAAELIKNIDYSNFKSSITDGEYHDACLDVWRAMYQYQATQ
jgi:hypothetical protein